MPRLFRTNRDGAGREACSTAGSLAAISSEGRTSKFSAGASPPPQGQAKAHPAMAIMKKSASASATPIEVFWRTPLTKHSLLTDLI